MILLGFDTGNLGLSIFPLMYLTDKQLHIIFSFTEGKPFFEMCCFHMGIAQERGGGWVKDVAVRDNWLCHALGISCYDCPT